MQTYNPRDESSRVVARRGLLRWRLACEVGAGKGSAVSSHAFGAAFCATRRRLLKGSGAAWCAAMTGPALAQSAPSGATVLTVAGKVQAPRGGGPAHFNMAMLEALPQTTLTTQTPWYAEPRNFTGPLLRELLAHCGAQGETLRLSALNDFRVDMPMADARTHDVIVARLLDGKPLSVRDKGPLFVMYPFSAKAELRSAVYYSRAVWQLRRIEVL